MGRFEQGRNASCVSFLEFNEWTDLEIVLGQEQLIGWASRGTKEEGRLLGEKTEPGLLRTSYVLRDTVPTVLLGDDVLCVFRQETATER